MNEGFEVKYEGEAGTTRPFAAFGGGSCSKSISGAAMEADADLEVVKLRELVRIDLTEVRDNPLWHLGHLEDSRNAELKGSLDAMVILWSSTHSSA